MSEAAVGSVQDELALVRAGRENVTLLDIFIEFLIIGATSFGGVVPYLRNNLVTKKHWVDDKEFVQLLSISQTLPGLNATNVAILLGDRLKGWLGALVAIVGVCLPGATLMFIVGIHYRSHGDHLRVPSPSVGRRLAFALSALDGVLLLLD